MTGKIQWDQKYSVDIPELDDYQKTLLEKFNALIDIRASKKVDAKAAVNMISDISQCIKMFFSSEERLLKQKGYPDFEPHSKAHRQFIKSTIALNRDVTADIDNLTMDIIIELRDWFLEHIETNDSLYVPFVRIHQYIEDNKKKS